MRYLVAALNWGVGHAARLTPIIKLLQENGHECIIASDGAALEFLKANFKNSNAVFCSLPSYNIKYNKKSVFWSTFLGSHWILKAVMLEKKQTIKLIQEYRIDAIISDNRLGVYSKKIPSYYITHQVNIKTGHSLSSFIASKFHQWMMTSFDKVLIPDWENSFLAGDLSQSESNKYFHIGPLSWHKQLDNRVVSSQLLVVLSGPEPKRTVWEKELVPQLNALSIKVCLVRGVIGESDEIQNLNKNIDCYDFLSKSELDVKLKEADVLLSRAGYSTIMDLVALKMKAILVPTPGQEEQEYLARYLKGKLPVVFQHQEALDISEALNQLNQMEEISFPDFSWKERKENILNLLQ